MDATSFIQDVAAINDNFSSQLSSEKEASVKTKKIFVCTLCQLFASSKTTIVDHITSAHSSCFLPDTTAESFVSSLKALPSDAVSKNGKKIGRPRKSSINILPAKRPCEVEEKFVEPIIDKNGLYCCKKCHKGFRKCSQFNRHVCLEINLEDEWQDWYTRDSDYTLEGQQHENIRRPKENKEKRNCILDDVSSIDETDDILSEGCARKRMKSYWRDDPTYVPLFRNESDKSAFEAHLKSIDYTSVDNLYSVQPKRVTNTKRKHCYTYTYTCTLCEKVFNALSQVRLHCLIHTDLKPFTCPLCPYRSNVKGTLYHHMRKHTGNVFLCSSCNFQTYKRAHLLEHQETHSTVTQTCKLCKNTYKNLRSLIAHVKRFHKTVKGKQYAIDLPRQQFSQELTNYRSQVNSQTSLDTKNQTTHISEVFSNELPENVIDSSMTYIISNVQQANEQAISSSSGVSIIMDPLSKLVDDLFKQDSGNHSTISSSINLPQKNIGVIKLYENALQQKNAGTFGLYENALQQNTASVEVFETALQQNNAAVEGYETALQQSTETITLYGNALQQSNTSSVQLYGDTLQQTLNSTQLTTAENSTLTSTLSTDSSRVLSSDIVSQYHDIENISKLENSTLTPSLSTDSSRVLSSDIVSQYHNIENISKLENSTSTLSTGSSRVLSSDIVSQYQDMDNISKLNKALNMELLDECFSNTNFNDMIAETTIADSELVDVNQPFSIPQMTLDYPGTSLLPNDITDNATNMPTGLSSELNSKSTFEERKSAETKLFEKCKQAPAYVCCVCSAIYICPSRLKMHLREHINTSLIGQSDEDFGHVNNSQAADEAIDNVCKVLQDPSDVPFDEEELEKLFTSCLDMTWYLPEVSVVLDNDPVILDSVLDDMSNFIAD